MKRRHAWMSAAGVIVGALLFTAGFWWGSARTLEAVGARAAPPKVYVVQELLWRFRARGDPYVLDDGRPGRPIKVFVDPDQAHACCRDLNRQKRPGNPFHYQQPTPGTYLGQFTTMGDDAFLALVRSEGLTPPIRDSDPYNRGLFDEPWVIWWDRHGGEWDERLVERLWGALDRLRFYEVVEVALER